MSLSHDDFIEYAINDIRRSINGRKSFVLILTPPGSSRGDVVKRLAKDKRLANELRNAEFLVYEELYKRLNVQDSRFKPLKVEEKNILDYIKGDSNSIEEALSNRCIVLIPKSTMDAVLLVRKLRDKLSKDWNSVKDHVIIKHLASLYMKKLDELKLDYPDFIKTRYKLLKDDDTVKKLVRDNEGVSLVLWNRDAELSGELKSGVDAIRALSPGQIGFGALVEEFTRDLGVIVPTALLGSVAYVTGSMFLAPFIQILLSAFTSTDVSIVIKEFLGNLAKSVGINVIAEPFKKFSEKFLGWLSKRDKERNTFIKSLIQFVNDVKKAHEYVENDEFEGIVDEVASEWELNIDTFRKFMNKIYTVTAQSITEDELNKRLVELKKDIERLESDVKDLVAPFSLPIYFDSKGLSVEFDGDEVFIKNVLIRSKVRYVHNPVEDAILNALNKAQESGWNGIIVAVGPKGVGKSVATRVALAKLLDNSYNATIAVEVTEKVDKARVKNFVTNARDQGYRPIFYLDPSKSEHYPTREAGKYEPNFITGLNSLIGMFSDIDAPLLLVLSDDQYGLMAYAIDDLKNRGINVIEVNADDYLNDKTDFLANVSKEYSKCSEDVNRKLAEKVTSTFKDNYTVATVLASDWLNKNNCDLKQISEALEKTKGRINEFIKHYLWHSILDKGQGEQSDYAERLAPLVLAVGLWGPFPRKLAIGYMKAWGKEWNGMDNDLPLLWFTQRMHGTIWDALNDMVNDAIDCIVKEQECEYLGDNPNYIISKIAEIIKEQIIKENKSITPAEVWYKVRHETIKKLTSVKGFDDHVRKVINNNNKHELAKLVGLAHTIYSIEILLKLGESELVKELRDWMLVGDEMPPSTRLFLREKASLFNRLINACEMINESYREARERGGVKFEKALETLGLLAITGGEFGKECLDKANTLIALPIQEIELTVIPILELEELARRLINNGEYDEVVRLLHAITFVDPKAANEILVKVVLPNHNVFDTGLSWAGKIVYTVTLQRLSNSDYWVKLASDTVDSICKDDGLNSVRCLYSKVRLYTYIAFFKSTSGEPDKANGYVDQSISALNELSKRSKDELVERLEDVLKLRTPFKEVSEIIDIELKILRSSVYHHASMVKSNVDLEVALDYANEACDTARDIGLMSNVVANCGLRARLKFLSGKVEDAVKEFRELWEETIAKGFTNIDRESLVSTLANYLVSLLAVNDLSKVKEEYKKYRPFLINKPVYWAFVAGLMRIYGEYSEDFYVARRIIIVEGAPILLKMVLLCLDVDGKCESICQFIKDYNISKLCYKLIETRNNPKSMKGLIISTVEERYKDSFSLLLKDVDDPREITEIRASSTNSISSFVEVLRFIIEGKLNKAKLIAEHWRDNLRSWSESVPEGLWNELGKSLSGDRCGDDCKMALFKLFYFYA